MKNVFQSRLVQLSLCCLLSVAATLLLVLWQLGRLAGDGQEAWRFFRALSIVEAGYDGEVDRHRLYEGALKGLVEALGDPYSVYLGQDDFTRLNQLTEGSFGGIGIVFGQKQQDFVVISALPGNPGAQAGIKSGHLILAVDGKPCKTMNMEQVAAAIRGEIGSWVELELADLQGKQYKVRLERKEIKNPSVAGRLLPDSKIGYIRIALFNYDTGEDFKRIYSTLEQQGMAATILDLRSNPGGLLDAGVAVAGSLVPKGPIVSVVDNKGHKFVESSSLEKVRHPLAVLVDHGTASAAEIVAGAVQDTGSGRLFGSRTFGKGSVQTVYRLDGKTAVKVTTAKYYTPKGTSIHNTGIQPDQVVEERPEDREDRVLLAAEAYLRQALQP